MAPVTGQVGGPIDQARQSEQLDKDNLLQLVSLFVHDLESPLASVKYLLSLLKEGRLDTAKPRHRQLVHSSLTAVARAESIVYDLLAAARSGDLGMHAQVEPVDLLPIVDGAIALAIGSATENQIGMERSGTVSTAVLADQRLLVRVLDNLLYNAVRHTPSGKKITLGVSEGATTVTIAVLDGGEGFGEIAPSILFEKFGQIQMRAMGKHRGVGLGLYFCQMAVTAMGGTIGAANHPSGGAEFTVTLNKA